MELLSATNFLQVEKVAGVDCLRELRPSNFILSFKLKAYPILINEQPKDISHENIK